MSQPNQNQQRVEASTFSKSTASRGEINNKMTIISGKSSVFDMIFPLMDEALKLATIKPGLYLSMMIFTVFELVAVSLWQPFAWQFHYHTKYGQVVAWVIKITLFTDIDGSHGLLIRFAIFSFFALSFLAFILFQLISYKIRRSYFRWTLYVAKLCYEFFSVLMMVPCGNFIGETLVKLLESKNKQLIIFFALGIVYYIIFVYGHFCNAFLFGHTIYVPTSPNACWDGKTHFSFIFVVSLYAMVAWITNLFVPWIQAVLLASKICFSIYVLWLLSSLPFVQLESNAIVAGIHFVLIAFDIIAFIQYFGIYISDLYHIISFFIVLFLGIGLSKKYIEITVAKISAKLDLKALESIENHEELMLNKFIQKDFVMNQIDDARRELFIKYGLRSNITKCKLFLRVGISSACPLFLDWSLIKFLAEYHNNVEIISNIAQFVAFFPCESRLLNYFNNTLVSMPKLGFACRFLAFQAHRIKGIRQSSASSEITEKLLELKQMSAKGVNMARTFWTNVVRDPNFLFEINLNSSKTIHMYKEAIIKWPNNCRLHEDYSNYLIECRTDYIEGLKMKYKAELIEQGKNFAIDYSFRSLVRAYPHYLKKQIIDVKGNFIKKQNNNGGSSNNSSNNSSNAMSSCLSGGELSNDIEDQLGKNSFPNHKLRLAFQRSLAHRRSSNNCSLKIISFSTLICSFIVILSLYANYFHYFDDRAIRMWRQMLLTNIRFGYDSTYVTMSIYWAYTLEIIPVDLYVKFAQPSPKSNNYNIQLGNATHAWPPVFGDHLDGTLYTRQGTDILQEIQRWLNFSSTNTNLFVKEAEKMANDGFNVDKIVNAFINRIIQFDFCDVDYSLPYPAQMPIGRPIMESLSTIAAYSLLKIANLSQVRYGDAGLVWLFDKGVCETISNIWSIHDAFEQCDKSLSDFELTERNVNSKHSSILMISVAVPFGLVFLALLLIAVWRTQFEIYGLLSIMANIDKKSKEEASKSLRGNYMEDYEALNESSLLFGLSFGFLNFMIVGCVFLMCAIFILIIYIAQIRDNDFFNLNKWMFYGISRVNLMLESFIFTLMTILAAKRPGAAPMINGTATKIMGEATINRLLKYNNFLLRGKDNGADNESYEVPPCIGVDPELDELHFGNTCVSGQNTTEYEYSCMGIDSGLSLYSVYIREMLDDPLHVDFVNKTTFFNTFNLMNNYLIDPTYEAADNLTDLATEINENFRDAISGICFGIILFLALCFVVFYTNLIFIDMGFNGAFQLLRRLPPLSIATNNELMNYLTNRKEEKKKENMTPAKSVIMQSKDSVLFLGKCGSIEFVNKTVESLLGYKTEQLLGQPLSTVIPEDNESKIYEQIEYMKNGDAPLIFEGDSVGITDDEKSIPINFTLLGVTDGHHNSAESFVVIIRDISQIMQQREDAEKAKAMSEQLLYQILPRDIVVRLNRGEVDISFVVPSATVIFIDIVKFSDYASPLTPAQIMENLSMVFASFDDLLTKYNLITKIKLIGDVYMAAAGLFNPDEAPQTHAAQVVQFGLDALLALEEVNALLDSSLQVRIGVNTDGPLIAGVLGIDKPLFDIIGDAINVAARLQSNGIPGTVQISQATFDFLQGMSFNIEPRGEIMLKGKGKKMAYIVRQKESSTFFA